MDFQLRIHTITSLGSHGSVISCTVLYKRMVIAPITIDNYLALSYLIITMRKAIQSQAGIRLYTHSLCKEIYSVVTATSQAFSLWEGVSPSIG